MAFAFLFPGQGSQSLNMMSGFSDAEALRPTFDQAAEVLGVDLWAMLCADSPEQINATINTQPLMLTVAYATYTLWRAEGGRQPDIVAGHSLGEYTALVVAGVLSFADALKLVRLRAQAMQSAVPEGSGAMAVVFNLSDDDVRAACREAAQDDVVEAANFNAPGQVVIAGQHAAVQRALTLCKDRGSKRSVVLPVSVPSHCSLMRPAAPKLAEALQAVTVNPPAIPVLHNADVASYHEAKHIRDVLTRQLYQPVRWWESVQKLAADGILQMVECAPSKVLAGLLKRIDVRIHAFSMC